MWRVLSACVGGLRRREGPTITVNRVLEGRAIGRVNETLSAPATTPRFKAFYCKLFLYLIMLLRHRERWLLAGQAGTFRDLASIAPPCESYFFFSSFLVSFLSFVKKKLRLFFFFFIVYFGTVQVTVQIKIANWSERVDPVDHEGKFAIIWISEGPRRLCSCHRGPCATTEYSRNFRGMWKKLGRSDCTTFFSCGDGK